MAGKGVIKLGLEFDTKSAIASYRQLVSEMQKGGADPKAIKQFTAAIEKAETELAQLAAEGSTGFTDSKGIEQYQKKVLKVTTSMQQLALRMQDFSKDKENFPLSEAGKLEQKIKDLKKAVTALAEEARKNLQTSLKNMGFSKTQAAEIANVVKNEAELKQRLEQEREIRQKNLDLAKEQAQASVDAARGTKAGSVESNSTRVKALTSGVNKISGVNPEAIRETVAEAFRSGIRKGVNNVSDIVIDLKKTFAHYFGEGTEITSALSEMLDKGLETSGEGISAWLNQIALKTNEALNPEKFKDLVASLNQVSKEQTDIVAGQFGAKMEESSQAVKDATEAEKQLGTATKDTNQVLQKNEQTAGGIAKTMEQSSQAFLTASDSEKQTLKSTEQLEGGFNRLTERLKYMFGFTAMFNKLRQIIRSTFNDIQQLDKAYASIAYVTNETVADLWSTYDEYAGMAEQLGQSTQDVIKASAIYRQQGLGTAEALELTTDTMKLATIAGNDYSTATQEMTAALRGFKMEMDEGSHVSDVYSELAAHAAAKVDDIAQAMSRTASIANSAGMSFENTSAFLTQMIETTQESAENIGTSMKTIIARFTELKENVAGTSDSEFEDLDFNKVDTALKSVGVSLKDTQGQFRNLDSVFLELSSKWDSLDRNTQRYIATVAAGSRQQSRFIALMDNYDRTIELINTAADSEGKAEEQFSKAADTIEFKLNEIKTQWEQFKLSILDTDFVKGLLDAFSSLTGRLKNVADMPWPAIVAPIAIIVAKNFILSFISTIKASASAFSTIGKFISSKITKSNTKIKLELEKKQLQNDLKEVQTQIHNFKKDNELLEIKTDISEKNIKSLEAEITELEFKYEEAEKAFSNEATQENLDKAAELEIKIKQLTQEKDKETEAIKANNAAIEENEKVISALTPKEEALKQKLADNTKTMAKAQLRSEAFNGAIQSATLALSGYLSGLMTSGEALTSFGVSMASIAAKMTASAASYVINQHAMQVANGETTLSFIELAAAEWSALWPLLLIAGIVAGGALLVGSFLKDAEEGKKAADATLQYKEALEQVSQVKSQLNETEEELKNLQEQEKSLKQIKKQYDDLAKKKIRNDEEEQQYQSLIEEIKEKYPEIISYEDSITGELQLHNNLLENKIELLDEEIKKQKELQLYQESRLVTTQNKADIYGSVSKVNSLLGTSIKATDAQLISDLGNGSAGSTPEWNIQLNNFRDSLYTKGIISELEHEALLNGTEGANKTLKIFQEVITGKFDGIIEDFSKETQDNLATMAAEFKEVSGSLSQFKNYLEASSIAVSNFYGDKPQWEQNLRSIYGAGRLDKGIIEIPELDISWKNPEDTLGFEQTGESILTQLKDSMDKSGISTEGLSKVNFEEYKKAFKTIAIGSYGREDYDDLDQDTLMFLENKFGIKTDKDYEDFFGKDGQSDWVYGKKLLEEYYAELAKIALESEGVYEVSEDVINQVGKLQDVSGMTPNEINEQWTSLQDNIKNLAPDQISKINELINVTGDAAIETQELVGSIFGADATKNTYEVQQALENFYKTAKERIVNDSAAKDYVNSIYDMLEKNQIPQDQWAEWFKIDFTKITNQEDFDKFKEDQIKKFKEAGYNEAEAMFEELETYAKQYGALKISIDTDKDYDAFMNSLDELSEKVTTLGDEIISVTKDIASSGEVSYSTFEKLKQAMEELDLDVYDYLSIDQNGKITASEDKLKQLFKDQIVAKKEKLEQTKLETEMEKSQLELQLAQLESQLQNIDNTDEIILANNKINESLIPIVNNWAKIVKLTMQAADPDAVLPEIEADKSYAVNLTSANRQAVKEELQKQVDILKGQVDLKDRALNKLELDMEHVGEEVQAQYREWQLNMAEAAESTNELAKKQEELAKAQQDVIDKQKSLNEAIADYNKLLYGSENRQSGLDLLYNYKEAISAFSDEMTRAQELMEDSQSINDSISALNRYTNAAHQRLAYMNAQDERYKAGLERRRNQLLGGSTSYTNELTGNTTTIDFGDYVKYNSSTGLMALDQKLIQDAKIADEWKDYIEKQVDDYNKIAQESLKNQDEIRKLEKEVQKRREDSIKKYADFEKDIAETLKTQYQEQVDDLKEKYDSMKEADDDYLNALQDAIDKQRKLRERENKWNDLAQKQKKLSLMARDTSGANALEAQKLEKEIQKDREQLLDESIDSVIENMQKLTEKQDELRQTEVELKEALLENTAYWNQQAEGVAAGFQTAEDYVNWFIQTATGLNEQTGAQFEQTMNEARDKFQNASEEIAWNIQDDMSKTGDAVIETITITGDEIQSIINSTSDTFVNEVSNTFERTRQSFNDNMDSAIEKIHNAQEALSEAINKLNETASAANSAADAIGSVHNITDSPIDTVRFNGQNLAESAQEDRDYSTPVDQNAMKKAEIRKVLNNSVASTFSGMAQHNQKRIALYKNNSVSDEVLDELAKWIIEEWPIAKDHIATSTWSTLRGIYLYLDKNEIDKDAHNLGGSGGYKKYASGGLVPYTGLAQVDGTPDRPEAFLSADDTERIGNAAKLLSDIPSLNRSNISTNNSSYGDTNIEVNLNIDHISSDVDIEEMLERVKQEIVDIARPIGTNVILQQQV